MPQSSKEVDAFNWFMSQAKRYPLLTASEEIMLAHRIQQGLLLQKALAEDGRDPDAAERRVINRGIRAYNKFFNCNLRILAKLATKWLIGCTHLSKEDLVQEGSIGLSRAILKFDPTLGYKFSTYAWWWVNQAISRALDNHDRLVRLPGACLTALKKVRNWQPYFIAEHGRMPTVAECAAHCDVTEANMKLYLTHNEVPISLNAPPKSLAGGRAGEDTLAMVICESATPEDILLQTNKQDVLEAALSALTPEQFQIIDLLFGLTGEKPISIHLTCQQTKIPKSKIVDIRDKAINRMKAYASRHGIRP